MRWNTEHGYAEVNRETLRLFAGEKEIYSVRLDQLLWYSTSISWDCSSTVWKELTVRESGDTFEICMCTDEVNAKILIRETQGMLAFTFTFESRERELHRFAGGLSLTVLETEKAKITIPHLIYNDNPSADPERLVPKIGTEPGKGTIVEEHRLPVPAVNVEWKSEREYPYLTCLSVPQVKEGWDSEYWAIGALHEEAGQQIVLTSGVLMFNGVKDVCYGGRCTPIAWRQGYRTLHPGASLEKTCILSWSVQEKEGRGFRSLLETGIRNLNPRTIPCHSQSEIIQLKKHVLDSRFHEDDSCCGYLTFGAANSFGNISGRPEYFLYGWTGQSLKLAWCDCALGFAEHDPARLERGIRAADFFVKNGESAIPGLFCGYYQLEKKQWAGDMNEADAPLGSRIAGECISDLLELMQLLRKHKAAIPDGWEDAVQRACRFFLEPAAQTADGVYPKAWTTAGKPAEAILCAAGMPCVQALAMAAAYFDDRELLQAAETRYQRYAAYHMDTFERPFARATMDAGCEDKEAGIYFFTTAALLYELTGKDCYREWAQLSGEWIATFVFLWETGFQPGSQCAERGFRTTGWPGVSVQNHHLDVFFPVAEMTRFGEATGNRLLSRIAGHVRDALTYGICTRPGEWGYEVTGEQGEQYYQTNYFQVRYPLILKYMDRYRGGMQVWNPSWITAQVLTAAIKHEMRF